MYRVNYSNGQVSEIFKTKKEAVAHIDAMDDYREFAYVQIRRDGEWFQVRR